MRGRVLAGPAEAGRVQSIFERALNILWHDGGLITLHGPGPLAAPFAAAVMRLPRSGSVTPGTAVVRHDRRMLLGPFVLDTEGATSVDVTIPPATGGARFLASAFRGLAIPAGGSGLSSPRGRSAQRELADGIRHRDGEAFVKAACALIGLGEGLTPAGDDCLVGALAVLHRFRPAWLTDHLDLGAQIATAARAGTTMVGREFILHALDGAFSEHILRVVAASGGEDVRRAVTALAETGGTSGVDTLDGIRIALEALSP